MANLEDKNKLTYPVQIGDQKIIVIDTKPFIEKGLQELDNYYTTKLAEIKEDYDSLLDDYNINRRVYSSKFNFQPVIGHVYHLYLNSQDEEFLSLIAPNEWNKKYIASFKLNTEKRWEKIMIK